MTTAPAYTITNESISIVWEGKPHVVKKGTSNFTGLRDAIMLEEWDTIPNFLSITKALSNWAKGDFSVDGNTVKYKGEELPSSLNKRILQMVSEGQDPAIFCKFWERLQKNPSFRSVGQLWGFLEHENLPLTSDGHFLAYKSVRTDYRDHHSGQFDNHPGVINEMPRNKISDDPDLTCHDGFHVGAYDYASQTWSNARIVICKVDPENVVCVPKDSSKQKMRVCKYEVIGNYGDKMPSTVIEDADIDTTPEEGADDFEDNDDDSVEEIRPTEEDSDEELPFVVGQPESVGGAATPVAVPAIPTEEKAKKEQKRKKHKFDELGVDKLMEKPIDELRQYAGKTLQIVGASKIPGGKTALVSRICDVRGE
jgi:hypothetical protein